MYRIGLDVGGTFTDVVLVGGAAVNRAKVASTPADYSIGVMRGLEQILQDAGARAAEVEEIVHGTTVATNAVLQRTGARTALVTTSGFRDVLELRRMRTPRLYDLQWDKPAPIVPRYLRLEVDERIDHRGREVKPVRLAQISQIADRLRENQVESVAICLLHAYANDSHEATVATELRRLMPGLPLSLSSEVAPEIGEFERTSTTVVDAYVKPIVTSYLESLESRLESMGFGGRLLLMQSDGHLVHAGFVRDRPVFILESGPAAGVSGVQALISGSQLANAISFDMGGTTAKGAIVEAGKASVSSECEIGGDITVFSRLMKGAGYTVRVPSIDLAEVGAGGGSIAWVDPGGALQVGPRSAGAVPGPASYGAGGEEATVTDANVVLGYIRSGSLAGGALRLDPDLAAESINTKVASPLGLGLLEAAYGIFTISNARMARVVLAVSTERGRDPRDFALIAYGGSGPIHAASMAATLGIRHVIVPTLPGVFSAAGLLLSDVGHRFVHTRRVQLGANSDEELLGGADRLYSMAEATLTAMGYRSDSLVFNHYVDARYVGQSFALTVEVEEPRAALIKDAFSREHEKTYGRRSGDDPVEVVNLRLVASVPRTQFAIPDPAAEDGGSGARALYFGPRLGSLETPSVSRSDLAEPRPGPLVLDEYDSTVVVPPAWTAETDSGGNLHLRSLSD